MVAKRPAKPTVKAAPGLVRSVTSFTVSVKGEERIIAPGQVLRAGDPAVKQAPELFEPVEQ